MFVVKWCCRMLPTIDGASFVIDAASLHFTHSRNLFVLKKQMKIYKFKDLTDKTKHSHFFQIILQNAVWCAKSESLNDEDEFKFELDYAPSPRTSILLTEVIKKYRTTNFLPPNLSSSLVLQNKKLEIIAAPIIEELIKKCRNTIGIACFSTIKADDRLWEEYGGNGNGACIEIEIPDRLMNVFFHPVHYVSKKSFHVDIILESVLFTDKAFETYRNILLTKTNKWAPENEIRFISKRPEVNVIVDGHITEIMLGANVPAITLKHVKAMIADHCQAKGIKITKL